MIEKDALNLTPLFLFLEHVQKTVHACAVWFYSTWVSKSKVNEAMALSTPILVLSKLCVPLIIGCWILMSSSLPLDANTKRESGKKAQYGNIQAAKV